MDLAQNHFGRILTHLEALLHDVELVLAKDDDFDQKLRQFHEDPVYKSITVKRFRLPVRRCNAADNLRHRLKSIATAAGPRSAALENYLQNLEQFLDSYRTDWDDHCYITVPVIAIQGKKTTAGLVYLYSSHKMSQPGVSSKLNVPDLTSDPGLLSPTNYFEDIARELFNTLYYVHSHPYDLFDQLTGRTYQLYFGNKITEGKSIGAALVVKFAINYIQACLGERYKGIIAPQCGTVITGMVDADGRVLPVDDVDEKIKCAIDEYGSSIRVILPAGRDLSTAIYQSIDLGNVYYVSTIEDLLEAALTSEKDFSRGLVPARVALFRELNRPTKDKLADYLRPGVNRDIYDRPPGGWLHPLSHEGGIYSACRAGLNRMDVKLGFEPSALQDGEWAPDEHEALRIVLDGSEPMNEFWAKDQKTHICRMTTVLFEIVKRIDPTRQLVLCGFLGHSGFDRIVQNVSPDELEKFLQHGRTSKRLAHRGPFFRPVYEAADDRNNLSRVFVISDSYIPDIDFEQKFSQFTLLRLTPEGKKINNEIGDAEGAKVDLETLYPNGALDHDLLNRYFDRSHGTFKSISINLGDELPIEWTPEQGVVSQTADGYVYTLKEINELKIETRFRLAYQYPHHIGVNVQLSRSNSLTDFPFKLYPTSSMISPLDLSKYGELNDEEFVLWRTICLPDQACPQCGEHRVHLIHDDDSEMKIQPRPVFSSLAYLKNGYVLLRESCRSWQFFTTGCQLGVFFLMVLDGALYWSQAKGHVQEVPSENDLFFLHTDSGTIYISKL
jgi:hypothetical protein